MIWYRKQELSCRRKTCLLYTSTSITDILGNMGTDAKTIQNIAGGDYSSLYPALVGIGSGLVNGNLEDAMNGVFTSLGNIFPNATTADYCDLISWVCLLYTSKDVYMKESTKLLEEVVVSAGRFEQKLSDVTVSMDVVKSGDIARQAPTDISSTLRTPVSYTHLHIFYSADCRINHDMRPIGRHFHS